MTPMAPLGLPLGNRLLRIYDNCKLNLLGDVNEDLCSMHECLPIPIYNNMVAEGLVQHVIAPTCDSGTLIDYIYSSNIQAECIHTEVVDCYYSDYNIVMCSLNVNSM